jgi:uncharacterized protein YdeI (YjbR/CyaY-like superfamily)
MKSYYAKNGNQWRDWLTKNAASGKEVWLIYYKKHSRKPSITHEEAVRQAICFGWIDGIVKKLDEERTLRRFSPRKPKSRWSALNIKRAKELISNREMTPAGLAVFKPEQKIETRPSDFSVPLVEIFRKNKIAWENYWNFSPSYRRMTAGWVGSAKKLETQMKRLQRLIEFSAVNRKIDFMSRGKK